MTPAAILSADQLLTPDDSFGSAPSGKIRTRFAIEPDLGSFVLESIANANFSIYQATAEFKRPVIVKGPAQAEARVGLALMASGKAQARFDHRIIDTRGGMSVFTYNPALPEEHHFSNDGTSRITYFEMSTDYFNQLFFGEAFDEQGPLGSLRHKITNREFIDQSGKITADQQRVLYDMRTCKLTGGLGNLMVETSLIQIFALQLATMGCRADENRINHYDKEVLHAVKDFLDSSYLETHSLLSLSKRFGINQTKLKVGFKELFGVPVIEYVYNLKMAHARNLILDKNRSVTEVASLVGYKYANHFTTAFKRKYGINPSLLKG